MRLSHIVRAGAVALALMGVAAAPALAQSGAPAGGDGDIVQPISASTMQMLFPYSIMPAQGGGSFSGFQNRVRTRESKAPNREDRILIGLDDAEGKGHINAIFGEFQGEGAGGLMGGIDLTTAESIPGVEIYADAIVSILRYRQFQVGALFGRETKLHGELRFRYTRRIRDNFFGLGPFAEKESEVDPAIPSAFGGETNYDTERRSVSGSVFYDFSEQFQAGIYADYTSTSLYQGDDDKDPSIFSLYSPYFPDYYCNNLAFFALRAPVPGLQGSKIFTYGAYGEYDARNNESGLTKGGYLYARIASHDSTDNNIATRDFGWLQGTVDARGYIPLFSDKTSLALRFFTDLNRRRGGSAIPFYDLARLGGSTSLRGFETFRFYGQNSILFQGELRQTFWTNPNHEHQGADVILFGDLGQVWGKGFESPCPIDATGFDINRGNDFNRDNYEADVGVGLAYRVSQKFAVRVDFGHSNEDNKVRVTFRRGF